MQFDDLPLPRRGARDRVRPLPPVRRPPEMPDALASPAAREPSFLAGPRGPRAALMALFQAVRREHELQRSIAQLHRLDDRSLRDIGIEDRSRIETLVRGARR